MTKFVCHLFTTSGFVIFNHSSTSKKGWRWPLHCNASFMLSAVAVTKKRTCKRPPSPKCSTSRMLSDCMKAVDRQSKFPWGLNISKQCHAGLCSVCKWLSRGVSDLDTITHQATQRTEETGNHYSHFAIIRCLHMSQVSSWLRSVENHIVSLSRVLLCKRS